MGPGTIARVRAGRVEDGMREEERERDEGGGEREREIMG